MVKSAGIHHITAICSDPKRNVAFYTGSLGLRMVKRTVNFDDPSTWHLYYGNETGSPGTALTFFAWEHIPPGRNGIGIAGETAFLIPEGSLAFWTQRLVEKGIPHEQPEKRFGETVIGLRDPDSMRLELVASKDAAAIPGWSGGAVAAEHAIRGFAGVTLWVGNPEPTAKVLTATLGFAPGGTEESRHRFRAAEGPLGAVVDLRAAPGFLPARMGSGSVHHVAFRAADDAAEMAMREAVLEGGLRPTEQIDRLYFHSVYFREPGGVLFEIATDAPGFTVDEPRERLGASLALPPWYEAKRTEIAAALPGLE